MIPRKEWGCQTKDHIFRQDRAGPLGTCTPPSLLHMETTGVMLSFKLIYGGWNSRSFLRLLAKRQQFFRLL